MAYEKIFVKLLSNAKPEILLFLVENNYSIVKYTLNHQNKDKVIFWIRTFKAMPFINLKKVNKEKIHSFFQKERPDLYSIMMKNPLWLSEQIDSAREWVEKL